ncbi:MAG: endonuclease [Roseburia sp.]|nr:endonuclease [Anaeroplasma bactoclasticum]MCM1196225.1 endonuclease [Roseburia sp.]MCM1556047.1 endonuclease [Anaeroplasma bactoclasticum]
MKKIFSFLCLLCLFLSLTSCKEAEKKPVEYVVRFDSRGGSLVALQNIKNGDFLIKPENPTREGYDFVGWYWKDEEFDFTTKITENMQLIAKWVKSNDGLSGYYEAMNGHLNASFKEALHKLLKETHTTKRSYSQLWDDLASLDQDPNNKENILCIYTGKSIPIANRDKGSAGNNIWNREHSWPNSHGFSSQDYYAYTDLHHLFASEKNINATRGNKDFNNVKNGNSDEYGNKWDNTYFEPRDEVKGDLARAMFYLVVRYDDPNELDLELSETTTSSSSNKTGKLGILSALLEWNILDPVSEEEKLRNEKAYSIQGNRNPFVDNPEWVNYLYPQA